MRRLASILLTMAGGSACQVRVLDVSGAADKGEACGLVEMLCRDGLVCAAVEAESGDQGAPYVCATPFEIHGQVIDAITGAALAKARVHAQDDQGAAPSATAVSDAEGRYVLVVDVPRTPGGEPIDGVKFTLQAFVADYQPFPGGIRVALPIAVEEAVLDEAREAFVIDGDANTTVALLPLPSDQRGGVDVSGHVGGDSPGGTLVVAEGGTTATYGIAGSDGTYTLFNVQDGAQTVRGYRRAVSFKARTIDVQSEDLADIDLEAEAPDRLAQVRGSVSLVNPGDGVATSVVLIPASLFDAALGRGPVPFGLRAPDPGIAPDIKGAFTITEVPPGKYRVLAGFENDFLIRDPDVSIGGTSVPEVDVVAGSDTEVAEAFKVTGALGIMSPGAGLPEVITGSPSFSFERDSGADHYNIYLYDALGTLVWETTAPKASGSEPIEVVHDGDALTPGMYYQFRAVSVKDADGTTALSATEDLLGVFIAG